MTNKYSHALPLLARRPTKAGLSDIPVWEAKNLKAANKTF